MFSPASDAVMAEVVELQRCGRESGRASRTFNELVALGTCCHLVAA